MPNQLTDNKCPCCQSTEIEGHSFDAEGGSKVGQEMYCTDCGSEWYDTYKLADQAIVANNSDEEQHRLNVLDLARCNGLHVDGETEIQDDAILSEGEDNGAYLQAWVWVDFAGTDLDKEAAPEPTSPWREDGTLRNPGR